MSEEGAAFCTQLLHASLSTGPSTLDAALVERLKSDDALSSMLAALGQAYPELMGPLLHERDAYLAWSLKDSGGDTLRFSDLVDNMNKREVKEARRSAALTRLAVELVLGTAAFAAWQFYVSAGAP
ncbi:TraB domain-containing isoform X1 [Haematococcus lacustris]|uniref:TraB domain-containing isoform X1 n=1 Tax=Haematococcus lacustris TaxID=44745 RepID=A0A699YXI7_HAELA|nr:TraB domain-containing isoform X1 [Haematococcus lacustris]